MKILDYVVQTPVGIHARNALLLSQLTSQFQSDIHIRKGERTENAKKVMHVMSLGIDCNDVISFMITGDDEEMAYEMVKEFCEGNL